jgi:site-specific recombinase XerD
MAKIYKRNKIWYLTYRYKGKRYRKRLSRTKRIAEIALSDLQLKIDRNEIGFAAIENVTFNKLAQEYLEYSEANKAESSYKRDLLIINKHALSYFGEKLVKDITPKMIEGYIIKRSSKVEESTVNRELNTLFNLFHKAVQWCYIRESPAKGIKKLKEKRSTVPKFLSSDEITRLLSVCPSKIYGLLYLAIYTGCRQSELFNLEWSDIDSERKQIIIQNKEDWHTKSYKHRVIPINDRIIGVLGEQNKVSNSRYVFCQENGEKLNKNKIRRTFEKAMRKAEIHYTDFKILRHTYASHLVMKGVDIRTVQKLLGHHSIKMTEKYSHLAPDHLQSVARVLDFEKSVGNFGHKIDTNRISLIPGFSQVVVVKKRPQPDLNRCRRRERAVS